MISLTSLCKIEGFGNNYKHVCKQECIPVGCVAPAAVAVLGGGLHQAPPWEQTPTPGPGPPEADPPDQAPPRADPPRDQAPPLWTESQTPVKI